MILILDDTGITDGLWSIFAPALHCGAKRRPWKAAVCRLFMTLLKKLQCMHVLCVSLCLMFSYVVLNKTLAFPSWIFWRYYITETAANTIQFEASYAGTLPWSYAHTAIHFVFDRRWPQHMQSNADVRWSWVQTACWWKYDHARIFLILSET